MILFISTPHLPTFWKPVEWLFLHTDLLGDAESLVSLYMIGELKVVTE